MAGFMNPLFDKVKLLKKDCDDPETASCFPGAEDPEEEEEEEEVPAPCVTPPEEMRDPLGHSVTAHTIADIILDKNTEMPLTIGVFGGSGSGKTTFHEAIKKEVLKRTSQVQQYKKKLDEQGIFAKRKKKPPKNLLERIDFYIIVFCYTGLVIGTVVSGLKFPQAFYYLLAGTVTAIFPIGMYFHEYVGLALRLAVAKMPFLSTKSSPLYHITRTYLDISVKPLDQELVQEVPERRTDIIWVDFNAWVFSGCKVLWAGIVTKLCDEVESHVGGSTVRLFRSIQAKAEAAAAAPAQKLLLPKWFRLLATAVVGAGLIALAAVGIDIEAVSKGEFPAGVVPLVPLVMGVLAKGKGAVSFGRGMVKSQSDNITSLMTKPDFAEQLGFMSEVKKEVNTVKSLLAYLERSTNIRYRIVVVVDDLSDCREDRVVGVLQALKVLLSDEDANIISLLCVNPKQVVKCLEASLKQLEDFDTSGYKYLNEIVNFAVCLPEPGVSALKEVLEKAVPEDVWQPQETEGAAAEVPAEAPQAAADPQPPAAEPQPAAADGPPAAEPAGKPVLPLLMEALNSGDVMPYVKGNPKYIRDLYFVLRMTAGVVEYKMKLDKFDIKDWNKLVAWVVLVQQWPYRVSWIVLQAEDMELKSAMKKRSKLFGCFEQSSDDLMNEKLHVIFESAQKQQAELEGKGGEAWKRFNVLDGDAELLQLFLKEFDFTVQDMFDLLPVTTNLDSSIKRAINSALSRKA